MTFLKKGLKPTDIFIKKSDKIKDAHNAIVSGNEQTKLPPCAGDKFEYLENPREISKKYPTGNRKGTMRWPEKTTCEKQRVFVQRQQFPITNK